MPATATLAKRRPNGTSGTEPPRWRMHRYQAEAFQSATKYTVVVAGRRGGKSEVEVMWALAKAQDLSLRGTEGVAWVVAPTYRILRVLWRKFQALAPAGWITDSRGTDVQPDYLRIGRVTIEFRSSDRPENLVAEGLLFLLVDESGIVRDRAWEESLLPTLVDHDAPVMCVGTPKGANWFHRLFLRGRDPLDTAVSSFHWTSWANPFVSRDAIADLANTMPERRYRQEILAEFLSADGAVFRHVRRCVKPPSTKPTAALGVDLAKVQDFTVIHGLDADGNTTHWDRFNELSWHIQKHRIYAAWKTSKARTVVVDATGVGDPIVEDLRGMGIPVQPFQFTAKSKVQLVERLAVAVENTTIGLPDEPVLLNEMEIFEYEQLKSGHVRYEAPEGAHDDCVIAAGLALWGIKQGVPEIETLHY